MAIRPMGWLAVLGAGLLMLALTYHARAGECITWEKGVDNLSKADDAYVGVKLTSAETDELMVASGLQPLSGWSFGYTVNLDLDPSVVVVFVFDENGCYLDHRGASLLEVLADLDKIAGVPAFEMIPKGPQI